MDLKKHLTYKYYKNIPKKIIKDFSASYLDENKYFKEKVETPLLNFMKGSNFYIQDIQYVFLVLNELCSKRQPGN